MEFKERFEKIVDINGKDFQLEIAVEECSEFIQAVQKYKRGTKPLEHILEEMADVLVTFNCLAISLEKEKLYTSIGDFITQQIDKKTKWAETYNKKSDNPITWQSTGA